MNVLIACEESQRVCMAFRERGHTAWSCDIQPCSGGHPEWHILGDCLPLLNGDCQFTTEAGGGTHAEWTLGSDHRASAVHEDEQRRSEAFISRASIEHTEILRRALRQGFIHGDLGGRLRESGHREPNAECCIQFPSRIADYPAVRIRAPGEQKDTAMGARCGTAETYLHSNTDSELSRGGDVVHEGRKRTPKEQKQNLPRYRGSFCGTVGW